MAAGTGEQTLRCTTREIFQHVEDNAHEELRRSPEAYTIGFVAVIIGRAQLFIVHNGGQC